MALGKGYAFWASYFSVKDALLVSGMLVALMSAIGAQRRRYAIITLLGGLLVLTLTPL